MVGRRRSEGEEVGYMRGGIKGRRLWVTCFVFSGVAVCWTHSGAVS